MCTVNQHTFHSIIILMTKNGRYLDTGVRLNRIYRMKYAAVKINKILYALIWEVFNDFCYKIKYNMYIMQPSVIKEKN